MMEWQFPTALYLILPLCAAWLMLALDSNRRRQAARTAFAAPVMWSRILPNESRLRFWIKLMLREIAIITGLIALAGPRFGTEYEQVIPRGADLYVLIDVSRSMLADDVPPSRLGRAKADVSSLLNRLEGERVGLIAFAGQAVVKCPLTVDYDSFRRSLEELDPDSAPRGGTAIGDAIRKGLEVFHANADRDQAMVLITDGDDQQSYPLDAAAVAKERNVAIFTIGLGDAERGARVPQKGDGKSFLEYQGEQVWSKLDGNLLEQIALKTAGVYVPAGTRAYDLGELYTNHLQGRHGNESATQQKIRRSERFQFFLALALGALLLDLGISPYPRPLNVTENRSVVSTMSSPQSLEEDSHPVSSRMKPAVTVAAFLLIEGLSSLVMATEPAKAVREGLRLYSKEQFQDAASQFAAATEELDKQKSASALITTFDEACAAHRNGDLEHARECYLRAGLSQDRSIAVASHFNLGMLAAGKGKELSGNQPELVPPDKRQEILDQLTQAITSYRHCLELQPSHAPSRRNLELIRQWVKHYSDQWQARDRQKRRDESNLLVFLEFLIQTQTALKATVNQLPEPIRSDTFAELKRAQGELQEEIPTLREKLETQLRPPLDPQTGTAPPASGELEEGIKLLQSWADTAGEKMTSSARNLGAKDRSRATTDQQTAIEELEKIWEAVIPFYPLLAKELADQTTIAAALSPSLPPKPAAGNESASTDPQSLPVTTDEAATDEAATKENATKENAEGLGAQVPPRTNPQGQIAVDDLTKWEEKQSHTLKRARLLGPKAESELNDLEKTPAPSTPAVDPAPGETAATGQPEIDPEEAKAGYRKAIELAPQAVREMEAAITAMKQQDRPAAATHAEEARRILAEMQLAQPKKKPNPQDQDQDQQDQQNQDQQDSENQSSKDQKKETGKEDEPKPDQDKNQDQEKDQEKDQKKDQDQKSKQPQSAKPENQVSQDRVEDALRKVRERQQEKRERDRKLKGQFFGRTPVDKDW
jgi:Ca-activated chloride channel family protein